MKIGIVGSGRMGAWFSGLLAKHHEVAAYDINPEALKNASGAAALKTVSDFRSFVPDVLLNAVSLAQTKDAFESVLPYLNADCVLSDIASVKGELPALYKSYGRPFVSTHPMFGPATGVDALKEENAIMIRESHPEARTVFLDLFNFLQVRIFDFSFKEHDEMMGYSLSTPFVTSLLFGACVDATAVPGTNFARHMKIVRGLMKEDDELISEILFNPCTLRQLNKMTQKLEYLKHLIRDRDSEEIKRVFWAIRENLKESMPATGQG